MTHRLHRLLTRINEFIASNDTLEENARNGIAELRAEIELLRQLLQSDRALGLSDEAPPSYSNLSVEEELE